MKTPKFAKKQFISVLRIIPLVVLVGVFLVSSNFTQFAGANSISEQIAELNRQNAANRNAVAELQEQALSYQDAIAQLSTQIGQLQAQINDNAALQAELNKQIVAAEAELERQKLLLGKNIRAMYLEGDISTLEMLASSNDLSEFLNKQQYRDAVQAKIKTTLDKITELKRQLKTQKEVVDRLLAEQQAQRAQLAAAKAKQDQLLTYNKNQQAAYNANTRSNQAKIAQLIEQQRRANQSVGGGYYFLRFPGTIRDHDVTVDNYPYKNSGFSMQLGPCSFSDSWPDHPDRWGYCTRQCVSYAAWAVERSGRSAPMYYGNAKDWVQAAYNRGIPVFRDPEPGDVAISTAGTWGHAMYVEAVEGNRIFVSQYNNNLTGEYSTQWRNFR